MGLVAVGVDGDRAWLEGAHPIGGESGRNHRGAFDGPAQRKLDLDREIGVAAGEAEQISLDLKPHSSMGWLEPPSRGNCAPGSTERFQQHVSLTTKLHVSPDEVACCF